MLKCSSYTVIVFIIKVVLVLFYAVPLLVLKNSQLINDRSTSKAWNLYSCAQITTKYINCIKKKKKIILMEYVNLYNIAGICLLKKYEEKKLII